RSTMTIALPPKRESATARASERCADRAAGARTPPSLSLGARLGLREKQPGLDHRIRIERHALDALIEQPAREVRMVRRPLTAEADIFPELAAGGDGHREQLAPRLIPLIEGLRHDGGVAIETEGELRHVVRADRHAIEILQILLRQQCVGR